MAKVSVIMPVYNGAKYIGQAVASVLAQSLQDWELVIVNDGSTDETSQILAGFSDHQQSDQQSDQRSDRIHVIHQANGGEGSARNAGLDFATGEYLAFLDADDQYLENAFLDLSTYLDQHPEYGIVYSDGFVTDENGGRLMRLSDHRPGDHRPGGRPGAFTGDILNQLVLSPGLLTVNCIMVRSAVVAERRHRFDTNLVIGPDWDFWIQIARFVQFGYLDRTTCLYRIHQANISTTAGLDRRKRDMIRQRYKIMNSGWFSQLSTDTRSQFLYTLILQYLEGKKDEQLTILQSPQVCDLPHDQQALLWRQAGRQLLQQETRPIHAPLYFQESLRHNPDDWKARRLLWFAKAEAAINLPIIPPALKIWNDIHRLIKRVTAIGKRQSRPMPIRIDP